DLRSTVCAGYKQDMRGDTIPVRGSNVSLLAAVTPQTTFPRRWLLAGRERELPGAGCVDRARRRLAAPGTKLCIGESRLRAVDRRGNTECDGVFRVQR